MACTRRFPRHSRNFRRAIKAMKLASPLEEMYIPVPESGCWIWLRAVGSTGYGKMTVRRKTIASHRYFFSIFNGPILPNAHICHKCDTRLCVNPSHLFLGSRQDNMNDMKCKGRQWSGLRPQSTGSNNLQAKLNESLVKEIRERHKVNMSIAGLADAYGVSKSVICSVLARKTWKHVE